MSFQAYIDNIKQKTGKTPEDFKRLAAAEGLLAPGVKTGQIVNWLKTEFNLGHGHAMAVVSLLQATPENEASAEDRIASHFQGSKERWRVVFDELTREVDGFGRDVAIKGGGSYLTFLKKDKKFAIVVIGSSHIDIGVKLKDVAPTDRFKLAGNWNSMVTHRVRVTAREQVDGELIDWLRRAYLSS